jgi:hypothetical protein
VRNVEWQNEDSNRHVIHMHKNKIAIQLSNMMVTGEIGDKAERSALR